MTLDGVITFPSSFYAIRGEKVSKKANLTCKLIPCPRELSSSCAVSLAFEPEQVEKIVAVIDDNRIKREAVFIYQQNGSGKKVIEWDG